MSSANRGVGPSSRGNKRTRDDEDLPSSAVHPPSSRECDNIILCSDLLTVRSNGIFATYASSRRRGLA